LKIGCACCVALAAPFAYADTPSPDVGRHLAAAREAAGSDLRNYLALGNSADPNYKPPALSMADLMGMPAPPPGKAFDNLYFVGSKWVSTWALTTSDGIILIDAMDNEEEAERIVEGGLKTLGLDPSKVKTIIVTHGHGDHIGDAVEIANAHNPKVVGIPELCGWLSKKGVKQLAEMNKGGTQQLEDIKVTMVHADHSCGILDGDTFVYGGEACGYVVEFENGVKMYHAGDTNVFGDMAIIRDLYAPKIAMLPIGDHYTMSSREAAYACNLLKPETVIPMHFGTFPVLTGRPDTLGKLVKGIEVLEMKPGETIS